MCGDKAWWDGYRGTLDLGGCGWFPLLCRSSIVTAGTFEEVEGTSGGHLPWGGEIEVLVVRSVFLCFFLKRFSGYHRCPNQWFPFQILALFELKHRITPLCFSFLASLLFYLRYISQRCVPRAAYIWEKSMFVRAWCQMCQFVVRRSWSVKCEATVYFLYSVFTVVYFGHVPFMLKLQMILCSPSLPLSYAYTIGVRAWK